MMSSFDSSSDDNSNQNPGTRNQDFETDYDNEEDHGQESDVEGGTERAEDRFSDPALDAEILAAAEKMAAAEKDAPVMSEEEEDATLDQIDNILELQEGSYPKFTLAKNKARFLRMVSWYRQKEEWIEVAPVSGVTKLFKQQTKELEGIRSSKLDYEMELETGTLTPSQRSYRRDELKMCKVQEKMAVHLISKLQLKIKSGRR